jgi:hypothetical protein
VGIAPRVTGLFGGLPYGLSQAGVPSAGHVSGQILIAPGQLVYLQIPANELRGLVDSFFPALKANAFADVASGWGHRYRAGHDLLLDVPRTFAFEGPREGLRHAGHIIMTDFPTKAGIPIPGFSHSGLGQVLEQIGIPNGWLQLSLFDSAVGILAVTGGTDSLIQALEGNLLMSFGTACQTFGLGGVELAIGIHTQNPLLVAGGIENVLAGLVSTWNTYSVYVNPLDFLGAAGISALLGFGIAYGLADQDLGDSVKDAIQCGAVGALSSVSSAFGFGAFAGLVVCRLCAALAEHQERGSLARMSVDREAYQQLFEALQSRNSDLRSILERTAPLALGESLSALPDSGISIPDHPMHLSCDGRALADSGGSIRFESASLDHRPHMLQIDPEPLEAVYRGVLACMSKRPLKALGSDLI